MFRKKKIRCKDYHRPMFNSEMVIFNERAIWCVDCLKKMSGDRVRDHVEKYFPAVEIYFLKRGWFDIGVRNIQGLIKPK